jgi:fermentation-respiration switch protein FrsA (DUF1100 family)
MIKRIKRMFVSALIGLLAGYLLLVVFVYFIQGRMVYFPTKEIANTPLDIGLHFEEVILRTSDGINISAWFIPAQKERGVILFCHGNAGNISHRLDSIKIFHDLNLSVFIFDYRGYGSSDGSPSEKGTYRDAEAAFRYLVETRNIDPRKIVIFGRSLGSAVAAEIGFRFNSAALILESGFTSVADLGRKYYPYLPVKLLSRFDYSTARKVGRIDIPKLIIHSLDDDIVPFEHGEKLFAKAAEPKMFLQIKGSHNDGFAVSGKAYINGLNDFITKHL